MDKMDRKILMQLQEDASLSHAEIGEIVGLSTSQVSRRIASLRQDHIITRQVALLDEKRIGLGVEVFVSVTLASYATAVVSAFHARIAGMEEVLDCCSTTGDADYFLRIATTDLQEFARFINTRLLGHGDVSAVRSSVVLERIKRTTALPLSHA